MDGYREVHRRYGWVLERGRAADVTSAARRINKTGALSGKRGDTQQGGLDACRNKQYSKQQYQSESLTYFFHDSAL